MLYDHVLDSLLHKVSIQTPYLLDLFPFTEDQRTTSASYIIIGTCMYNTHPFLDVM